MRILFFAHLKNTVGQRQVDIPCDNVDADGLWQKILDAYPALAPFRSSVRLAKNSEYASRDERFHDTDEVALIPPVSGG